MSVVNKMLQDLEARKAQPDNSADYQATEQDRKIPWRFLILALVLISLGWYAYTMYVAGDSLATLTQVNDQVIKVAETNVKASAEPTTKEMTPKVDAAKASQQAQSSESKVVVMTNQNDSSEQGVLSDMTSSDPQFNSPPLSQANQQTQPQSLDKTYPLKQSKSQIEDKLAGQPSTDSTTTNLAAPASMKTRSVSQDDVLDGKSESSSAPSSDVFNVKSSSEAQTEPDIRQQVQVALKRGDERTATELLTKLIDISPTNEKARKRLAAMLFSQGKRNLADTIIQQGIDLQPDNQELRLMQARMHVQMKNPSKAHELLADYAVSAALSPDFVSYRAALAQQVERYSHAKQDYQQLTLVQPSNAKWWLGLAVAEERMGNNDSALSAYQSAKELAQFSVEVDKFVEQRIRYLAGVN